MGSAVRHRCGLPWHIWQVKEDWVLTCTAWKGELGTSEGEDEGGGEDVAAASIAGSLVEAVTVPMAPPLEVRSTPALLSRGAAASAASTSCSAFIGALYSRTKLHFIPCTRQS